MMMRMFYLLAIFMLGALGTEDLKLSIDELEKASPSASVYLNLARSYLSDQEEEKAFRIFLKSLELEKIESHPMGEDEAKLYDEALKLYLNTRPEESEKVSYQIIEKYGPILSDHPDYRHLSYIVASSYANLKLYEPFFILFARAYQAEPKHFLAYKALACVHIKLLERAKTEEVREEERKLVINNLESAQKANPNDFNLYRIEILFSPIQNRNERIKRILNKILALPMIPTRSDALFFTELAYETKDVELANKMVDKALSSFPGSRVIQQLRKQHGN